MELRWRSRGDLLHWWRTEVAQLSQREVADRLGVARSAVTNWELGLRVASIDAAEIDEVFEAGGVLARWLWFFDTPKAFDARQVWSACYPGESTSVWIWVRSDAATVTLRAEWGMYRVEGDIGVGENGFLVTVAASIEAAPLVVQLSVPGWVDFGRGVLPAEVPGAPVLDALDMVLPSSASGVFTELLTHNIAQQFQPSELPIIARLGDRALKPTEPFLGAGTDPSPAPKQDRRPWPPVPDGDDDQSRARYASVREARLLSLAETSQRLATMTDTVASKDTLRRFEGNIGEPHDPLLPAALDHVLGAEGHLCLIELVSGRGSSTVSIPRYWNAPVWIEFDGADSDNSTTNRIAELQWGNWRRRIDGQLPLLVLSHAGLVPLRIVAEPGIEWTVGLGRRAGAVPIDHGWVPDSVDTTQWALSTYQAALAQALNQTRRQPTEEQGP